MKSEAEVGRWFAERMPDGWFEGTPEVTVDREEILVVGSLANGAGRTEARTFREDTRQQRIEIAQDAEELFRRKVSWGVRAGDQEWHFTTLSVPVMTRLRQRERRTLDTLVDAGVARSRSHALAWCVRLVAEHEEEWIAKLREALTEVEKVRAEGPS